MFHEFLKDLIGYGSDIPEVSKIQSSKHEFLAESLDYCLRQLFQNIALIMANFA